VPSYGVVALDQWLTYTFGFISREWPVSEHDWLTRVGWFLSGNWGFIRDGFLAIIAVGTAVLLYRRTRATEALAKAALEQSKVASQQAETASQRHEQQTDADRQRRITDSFARAIEQLGSEKFAVRLGAIYALERIARESPEDHWPIMETLTAYVRESRPLPEADEGEQQTNAYLERLINDPLPADVQAALTVIGRRQRDHDVCGEQLSLRSTNLTSANLKNAHLGKFDLEECCLFDASLEGADLKDADLGGADLRGRNLTQEQLDQARGSAWTKLQGGLTIPFCDDEGRPRIV
jgi:hypothetical protein